MSSRVSQILVFWVKWCLIVRNLSINYQLLCDHEQPLISVVKTLHHRRVAFCLIYISLPFSLSSVFLFGILSIMSYFLHCLSFCLSISYPFLIVSTHSNVAGWRRMREMLTKQSVNSTIVVALRPPWVANEFNSYFILPFDLSICFAKLMFQKEKCVPHYCFYYSLQINSIVNKIYEKECKDSHWSFEI